MSIFYDRDASATGTIAPLEEVSFDPTYGYNENYAAMALEYMSETETNWSNIMKTIGISELACLEATGEEMVYEAVDIHGFFAKAKEIFMAILKKIKEMFERFMSMLASFVMSNKTFIKHYKAKIQSRFRDVKDFKFKGYEYTIDALDPDKAFTNMSTLNAAKSPADPATLKSTYATKGNELADTLRGEILGKSSGLNSKEFSTELFKVYRNGDSSAKEISKGSINIDSYITDLENGKKAKEDASSAYKKTVSSINKLISSLKTLENKAVSAKNNAKNSSAEETQGKEDNIIAYKSAVEAMKTGANLLQQVNGAHLQAIKDRTRQAKGVCTKVLTGALDKDAGKVKTESVDIFDSLGSALDSVELI